MNCELVAHGRRRRRAQRPRKESAITRHGYPQGQRPSTIGEKVSEAEKLLGHDFSDKSLIEAALTHPSTLEDGHEATSYERLEFLGDSVVGMVVAEEAYRRFPDVDEGGLTRIKISLVSGEALSQAAGELGIADLIIFGFSEAGTGRRGLTSALENVYESLTGALYLDAGMDAARDWVIRTIGSHISKDLAAVPENPKSLLQEILQAHGEAPEYEIVSEAGPAHDRKFVARALVRGCPLGDGEGRTKKEAEAHAASVGVKFLKAREASGKGVLPPYGDEGRLRQKANGRKQASAPSCEQAPCPRGD